MGVMSCDRNECDNVMCDRYSDKYRSYLCDVCFEELVSKGPETNVKEFLSSKPDRMDIDAARARFDVEFPLSRDVGW